MAIVSLGGDKYVRKRNLEVWGYQPSRVYSSTLTEMVESTYVSLFKIGIPDFR